MKQTNTLPEILRQKRISAGLTQKEVADILGYTTAQFISNWERGLAQPPVKSLKKITELYQISTEDLFDLLLKVEVNILTESLKAKFRELQP